MDYLKNINFYGIYNNISDYVSYMFSSKKQFKKEDLEETVTKLQSIRENIDNRIISIDKNIDIFLKKAKDIIKTNKKGALYNLKLKKRYMMERDKLYAMSFNIEAQIFSIESFALIVQTADTLKSTSIHMNKMNNHIDMDKIENTMDELQEQKEINNDLQNIISESMSMNIDEDELMEELVNLEKEENNICLENVNNKPPSNDNEILLNKLPIAPSGELKDKKTEEKELIPVLN